MLCGTDENPADETELVELLSEKVSKILESAPDLADALKQFVMSKGLDAEHADTAVQQLVAVVASTVRSHVRYDVDLFAEIKAAWQAVGTAASAGNASDVDDIARRFFAYRLYDQPKDDIVRTGDVVAVKPDDEATQDPPELHLVITPPCDLTRFWKKTRGCLTLAPMHPLAQSVGAKLINAYGNSLTRTSSVTAAGSVLVMPSLPLDPERSRLIEYVLLAYEQQFRYLVDDKLIKAGQKNKSVERPLTYTETKGRLARICRVSEPFLAGILAHISQVLFRPGIPDFPQQEKDRLESVLKAVANKD